VIDDGRSALNGILELATAGDEPRAYEVVAEVMTAVIAASKELIVLHKTRKETLKQIKKQNMLVRAKLRQLSISTKRCSLDAHPIFCAN